MCLLCSNQDAYAGYMAYLDAMKREGKEADENEAMMAAMKAADDAEASRRAKKSPFICDPIQND